MKITVVEYSAGVSLDTIFHNPADFDEICGGVHKANRRISANLKIKRDTLQTKNGSLLMTFLLISLKDWGHLTTQRDLLRPDLSLIPGSCGSG